MHRFLHAGFAAAVRATLPADLVGVRAALPTRWCPRRGCSARWRPRCPTTLTGYYGPTPPTPAPGPHRSFDLRGGLLYSRSPRCVRSLRDTVLQELHATPLGGHLGSVLGRNKTLALARRSVWWPGLSAAVEKCIHTCPTCQRVKEDNLQPAGLLFPLPVPSRRDGSMIACIHRLSRTSCGSESLWPRLLQVAGAY